MVRVDSIQTGGQAASGGGQDDVIKAWTAPLLASSIPTLVLTRDGAVLEANAASAEFFAGAAGAEVGSFLDQDSAADLKRGLNALAGGGELALALELSGQVGEGLPRPLRADLLALRDREGVLLCVVAQFRGNPGDVSGPAMMGMAEVMSAFDNFPLHMALLGPDLKPVKVHRALAQMLGYDENRILGDKAQDIVHPDDIGRVTAEVGRLLSGEADAVNFEIRNVIPSGQLRWMKVSIVANRDADGVANYFVSQGEDITERKIAELQVQNRAEFEQLITELSTHFIELRLNDIDGGVNDALKRLGRFVEADGAFLLQLDSNGLQFTATHSWSEEDGVDLAEHFRDVSIIDVPVIADKLIVQAEPFLCTSLDDLPEHADNERRILSAFGLKSLALCPLIEGGQVVGAIGFSGRKEEKPWGQDTLSLLAIASEMFANALGRWRSDERARRRAEFGSTLGVMAADFINLSPEAVDNGIHRALAKVGEFIGVDGCFFLEIGHEAVDFELTYYWSNPASPSLREDFSGFAVSRLPWLAYQVLQGGEPVSIDDVAQMPEGAEADREALEEKGVKSFVVVPTGVRSGITGIVGMVSTQAIRIWDEKRSLNGDIAVLRVIGEMFMNALERKHVDVALRESEARFREVVENISECFWVVTSDFSRFLYASPAYEEISGLPIEGIYKNFSAFLEIIHSEDLPLIMDVLSRSDSIREPLEFSCRILRGGTELRWIRVRIVPVVGDDGEVDKLAGTVEDITVQKQSEQEARRHHDNLAHAQRLNTVGQMAVELAHEINQPLSAIVSFASGCQRLIRGGKVDEATLVTALDSISAQALRGAAIVKRLRGFVQREEPHLEGVDINDLVTESAGFIEAEVRGRRINVSFDLDPAIPTVLADSVQVEQVVLNLMRNGLDAIESQPRGGGELIVRTARKGIDVVEVRVIDSGPGLGDADSEKIFDAFYTTKGGGLGMGLSISRSIIEAHGGRLWAESNSEAGMTFTFSLPVHIQRRDHGR
ncbi:MAG: PAS domain S-box protein [Deltaproteobacteria bacterium]